MIQNAIDAGADDAGHTVIRVGPVGPDDRGERVLTDTIELPSYTTLLLDGAELFLADGANVIMIENRDFVDGNEAVQVVGRRGTRLNGNAQAQARSVSGRDVEIWMEERGMDLAKSRMEVIGDKTVAEFEDKRAMEGVHRSMGLRFYNVDDLSIRGLIVGPTNAGAIHPERVTNLRIDDVTLAQDGREQNQDGIHVLGPAERVTITNIDGTCGDDAVARGT